MDIYKKATLAATSIELADEVITSDQREAAHHLQLASNLLRELESAIQVVKDKAPSTWDSVNKALFTQLTDEQKEDQYKQMRSAYDRSKRTGLPSGIQN